MMTLARNTGRAVNDVSGRHLLQSPVNRCASWSWPAFALAAKQVRISTGPSPALPNQCGSLVSNSAASPTSSTTSWSPRTRRRRPESTYIHS